MNEVKKINSAAVQSLLDYLHYLKESNAKSANIPVIVTLLCDGFSYSSEDSYMKFSKDVSMSSVEDSELTVNRLRNFTEAIRSIREDGTFQSFLSKLAYLGYFRGNGAGDIEYLKRYIAATYKFTEKLKGKSECDEVFSDAIFELCGRRPVKNNSSSDETDDEKDSDNEAEVPNVDEILKSASVWDYYNVSVFKPAKQVVVDDVTASVDHEVEIIMSALDARAKKGPDLLFSFAIFAVAFTTMFILASNSNVKDTPWLFRLLWVLSFGINLITVSIPGRLDRMFKDGNHLKPWHSLFEAATWAFAIWSVIYFAQTALTLYVALVGLPPTLFQVVTPYWLAANWFCALWCYCFRPEFKNHLWVPLIALIGAAATFGLAHYHMTMHMSELDVTGKIIAFIARIPMAMHFGWQAGAIFLTLNSWLSVSEAPKGTQIAVAFTSAFLAAGIGGFASWITFDPVIALTVAWALDGIACRTLEKAHVPQSFVSQDIHESLSVTESLLSNGLKIGAIGLLAMPVVTYVQSALPSLPDL